MKTIAITRMATGAMFLLFGEYKVAGAEFVHGGFEEWVHMFVNGGQAVGFYKLFLTHFVLAHPVFCARMVGWGELAMGLSLVLGFWVRPASIAGIVHMINLALATWFQVGHGAPVWRYFGAELDHLALAFLFAIFFATRAGESWGIDARKRSRKSR